MDQGHVCVGGMVHSFLLFSTLRRILYTCSPVYPGIHASNEKACTPECLTFPHQWPPVATSDHTQQHSGSSLYSVVHFTFEDRGKLRIPDLSSSSRPLVPRWFLAGKKKKSAAGLLNSIPVWILNFNFNLNLNSNSNSILNLNPPALEFSSGILLIIHTQFILSWG